MMFILSSLALVLLALPRQGRPGRRHIATAASLEWYCCPKLTNESESRENLGHQVAASDISRKCAPSASSLLSLSYSVCWDSFITPSFFRSLSRLRSLPCCITISLIPLPSLVRYTVRLHSHTLEANRCRVALQVNRDSW